MSGGIDERYLKELQQVLEAEAELARQGTDLLADPEYRVLRELFIDGDLSLVEFLGRVEALAGARPDQDERVEDGGDESVLDGDDDDDGIGGEDDGDDGDDHSDGDSDHDEPAGDTRPGRRNGA